MVGGHHGGAQYVTKPPYDSRGVDEVTGQLNGGGHVQGPLAQGAPLYEFSFRDRE